jgi:hypothetical protein
LDADERAAARAYLQRSEVRLSTVHRVATALLSGAGLMVLLPVVGRDAVVGVLRHLFTGELDAANVLLGTAVLIALTVPLVSLLLVFKDLTGFYFHANHLSRGEASTFAPRFTLTGLQLPAGELREAAASALDEERENPTAVELLVPDNDMSRARTDNRIAAYGPVDWEGSGPEADRARARALFELAASRERSLLEEVAKVEHGMARHVLRIQMIVLRYVKATLALMSTALAVFAAAAVVEGKAELTPSDEAWMAAIVLLWAPFVVVAVSTPVRWLDALLRSEGATDTAVGRDADLTLVEDVTVRLALAGFVAAAVVMVISVADETVTGTVRTFGGAALLVAAAALAYTLRQWGAHSTASIHRRLRGLG